VLNWWLHQSKSGFLQKLGLPLKYTEHAIDDASKNGHVNVLNWWLKSGLELKYTSASMLEASLKKSFPVLDWWLYSGLKIKYNHDIIDLCSSKGYTDVLDWWLHSGLELKYSGRAPNSAPEWFAKSGLPTECPRDTRIRE